MKIRSVTVLTDVSVDEPELALAQAANFLHGAVPVFERAGFPVQTRRVATQPFPRLLEKAGPGLTVSFSMAVQDLIKTYGIDYASLGPVCATDDPDYLEAIPALIGATETVFAAIDLTAGGAIDLPFARRAADAIRRVSTLTEDGLSNLFLAVLANVPPGAPFFPAAYHARGQRPRFALAIEAADLAVEAFDGAETLAEAADRLRDRVQEAAWRLADTAESLAREFELPFGGIDFSLAPYPQDTASLGGALERLGASVGGAGSALAAAVITSALDRVEMARAGFNGLMLPVLEDSVLARRAAEGRLTTTDLLLYSAICGTGLDTIPLPGDVSLEALAGLLLDIAALALRLDKPLTARLMPLPGKAAGDDTGLESFEYFAPGRVMHAPEGIAPDGLMAGHGAIVIEPRLRR
ncbi:MAG: hypothetical protein Kow0077_00950 [Anaerolineae bacterium]